jgi:hypothetical protein
VRTAIDTLQQLRDKLAKAGESYWAEQVDIQRLGASAWLAFKEGRKEEALSTMKAAADREDRTEKNAVTPGPIAPARELLGEMLLQLEQPADALAAFETTLKKEPNRYRALAGAAEAAKRSTNDAAMRKYYGQLLTVATRADSPARPELDAARKSAK